MKRRWIPLLALCLAVACGDDDGGTNDADASATDEPDAALPAEVTIEDLCGEEGGFAKLIGRVIECNPEFGLGLNGFPAAADVAARCDAEFGPMVTDGTIGFADQDALAACMAFINDTDCDVLDLDSQGNPCEAVILGTIAEGSGCEGDEQCAGDAYCAKQDDATCGTCAAAKAEFENCFENGECAVGRCLGVQGDTPGMCLQPGGLGEPCAIPGGEGACLGRLQCNNVTQRCQRLRVWAEGDDCNAIESDCNVLEGELYCNENTNKCEKWLALGDDCSPGFPACNLVRAETCDVGVTDKCIAPTVVARDADCGNPTGEVCAAGDYCSEPFDGGTCTKMPAPGDACVIANPESCGPNFLLECVDDMCQYENTPTGTCTGN